MIYQIKIQGLKVFGYHGVLPHETQYGQDFYFDCVFEVAAESDDELSATVSYATVADKIEEIAKTKTFQLIESLARELLVSIMALDSRILGARITVHKPSAPLTQEFQDVSVSVGGGTLEN
ncbi:MAG: dihydroneopterin aldolase [Aquiluna sp.]|nr:dihydroneopterin aldolase [Aquiluna sp.]MCF8545561.1 dihydroneopterin aldolase [Aquiluna sp.]